MVSGVNPNEQFGSGSFKMTHYQQFVVDPRLLKMGGPEMGQPPARVLSIFLQFLLEENSAHRQAATRTRRVGSDLG